MDLLFYFRSLVQTSQMQNFAFAISRNRRLILGWPDAIINLAFSILWWGNYEINKDLKLIWANNKCLVQYFYVDHYVDAVVIKNGFRQH